MIVKILSGDILELPDENWEKPAIQHLINQSLITPEDRPFVKLSLYDNMLFVELQTIANYMRPETWSRETWWRASTTPAAISFLEENLERIDWRGLSANSAAGHLLRDNLDKVSYDTLSSNESEIAMELLEQHLDLVDWVVLAQNTHPAALALMRRYPDRVDYRTLCRNWTPEAIDMIREFDQSGGESELDWFELTMNPEAVILLLEKPHRICHNYLCYNPRAQDLCVELGIETSSSPEKKNGYLEMYKSEQNWYMISSHPDAGELLYENPERVDQLQASGNRCVYRKRG